MDKEKQINVLKESAQLLDGIFVAGQDKHKIIAVIQALQQIGMVLSKETGDSNERHKGDGVRDLPANSE